LKTNELEEADLKLQRLSQELNDLKDSIKQTGESTETLNSQLSEKSIEIESVKQDNSKLQENVNLLTSQKQNLKDLITELEVKMSESTG
jgi:chromosome segregation ATPase